MRRLNRRNRPLSQTRKAGRKRQSRRPQKSRQPPMSTYPRNKLPATAKPVYPRLSRRLGEEGIVILKVFVTAEGRAGQVQLHNSSGHPLLDESALLTVRTWRFQPAAINGQPIAEWYQLPIPFMLLDHS